MFYVYLIRSNQLDQYYIGQTNDLKRRVEEHKTGKSNYTSRANDWVLLYYEAYTSRRLAMKRESSLKPRARSFQELIKRVVDESGEG